MDEIQLNYNAYKTVIELCRDRNYIISDEYLNINFETFKYLYLNKQTDIYCTDNSVINKKIYIKFVNTNKIKPNNIREFISNITKDYLSGDNNELLIILKNKPNNSILKIQKEKEYKHAEILWLGRLQFNITKHNLVPKHIEMKKDELDSFLQKYNILNIYQLPHICKDDAIVKYYNFKVGTVLKIIRPSQTAANHTFYRVVK